MPSVHVARKIAAPPQQAWSLLKDFAHIDAFNPNLLRSFHIGATPLEGLGAERQCDLKDGRNWIKERVVDWREGEGYTVEIYAGTLPITDILTTLGIEPDGSGTRAVMQMTYRPKFGLPGRFLDAVVLRRMTRGLMMKVLDGLAEKAGPRRLKTSIRDAA